MFDTVTIGDREAQFECFGRMLEAFELGSAVVIYQRTHLSTDEAAALRGTYERLLDDAPDEVWDAYVAYTEGAPLTEVKDFAVAVGDGSFVVVRNGRIHSWVDVLDEPLPVFDSVGDPSVPMVPSAASGN